MGDDMSIGAKVLTGDRHWKEAGLPELARVVLFGEREVFVHLGVACTIRWWRGKPYLSDVREARP